MADPSLWSGQSSQRVTGRGLRRERGIMTDMSKMPQSGTDGNNGRRLMTDMTKAPQSGSMGAGSR